MPRKRIEFIDEYLCPNDNMNEYNDCNYQYHDNHGILIRCKDCRWRGSDNCPMKFYWDSHPDNDEAFCSFAEKSVQ